MTPPRKWPQWLLAGLARPVLWSQLAACALLLALIACDYTLVSARVSCELYRRIMQGPATEIFGGMCLLAGAVAFAWRELAQLACGKYRGAAVTVLLLALEILALAVSINLALDKTLFYCAFDDLKIEGCLFCVH